MNTLRWTDEFIDAMRHRTDPEADTTIAEILGGGESGSLKANEIFDLLTSNSDPMPPGIPPSLADFFEASKTLPSWADPKLIAEGERFFSRYGMLCVLVLICKSLPECYAGWRGAQVLYSTGRMNEKRGYRAGLAHRIVETAQFILDVMAEGGLGPEGRGMRTTQKIRLIHASIRYYLRKYEWDTETLGEPINQEDLAGTLLSFSVATLDGLAILNFDISRQEEEAYLHVWKVVGYVLGIDESLLPADIDDARELWRVIRQRQHVLNENKAEGGRELTKSLSDFIAQMLPGGSDGRLPLYLMRTLLDDNVAKILDLPSAPSEELAAVMQIVRHLAGPLEDAVEHSEIIADIAAFSSHWLMESLVHHWNDGKQVHFSIPPSLQGEWNVKSRWDIEINVFGHRLVL